MKPIPKSSCSKGFTLIELSIVLVIIGLLVAGVLVGQEMINGAKNRKTMSEMDSFTTSVNLFQNKFSGLPGDITGGGAKFGLTASSANASTIGLGNGNGLIEGFFGAQNWGSTASVSNDGEVAMFWRHLFDAKLVSGTFNGTGDYTSVPSGNDDSYPAVPAGNAGRFIMASDGSKNYWVIARTDTGGSQSFQNNSNQPVLKPSDAAAIDSKLDDGNPAIRRVISIANSIMTGSMNNASSATDNNSGQPCYTNIGFGDAYNTSQATLSCNLRIEASF